jgi:hypothetical protein
LIIELAGVTDANKKAQIRAAVLNFTSESVLYISRVITRRLKKLMVLS